MSFIHIPFSFLLQIFKILNRYEMLLVLKIIINHYQKSFYKQVTNQVKCHILYDLSNFQTTHGHDIFRAKVHH